MQAIDVGIASLTKTVMGLMTIEEYAAEIDRIAVSRRLISPGARYYGNPDVWLDMQVEGLTPEEALDEELVSSAWLS